MTDTFKPMDIDLMKDLHGHVRVELRDRWTGRVVDSQEKDNLVTNALQALVAAQAWMGGNNNVPSPLFADICPIWSKGLGGLLLFDGTLTEAATNIGFPSSVKLIGCAGQTSDNANIIKGSLNPQESVYTSTGFTSVWDFGTTQANGTIASLARTSHRFISSALSQQRGGFTYGSDTSVTPTSVAYLGYDKTNAYLYLGLTSAATIGGVTYPRTNIYRVKAAFDSVGLLQSYLPPISLWTSVKTLSSSDGSANASDFVYDEYENNFVYATGTTIHLVAMDGTHTTKTAAGTSGNIVATENYYWRYTQDNIYCIQKSNPANVQTYSIGAGYNGMLLPITGDVVATCGGLNNTPVAFSIVYPDGTSIAIPEASTAFGTTGHAARIAQFIAVSNSFALPTLYLGTIANLDSPVTKSSSQTMKIIYTLTEA